MKGNELNLKEIEDSHTLSGAGESEAKTGISLSMKR